MDAKQGSHISPRLPGIEHRGPFPALKFSQLERTAQPDAPVFRRHHPGHGAFRDHFPLELCHDRQNAEDHPALRVRRIDSRPFAGQDFQADAPAFQILCDHDQIVKRPRQPVEFPDHQHVTGSAAVERGIKALATVQEAGSLVLVDDLAPRRPQRVKLEGKVLFLGRDAGIADFHAPNFALPFCTGPEPLISKA